MTGAAASVQELQEEIHRLQQANTQLEDKLKKCQNPAAPPVLAPLAEWSEALLQQSREDLDAAKKLVTSRAGQDTVPMGVFCMLMQMSFEKMGKAALARSSPDAFRKHRLSHATASKMVRSIKLMNTGLALQIRYRWKAILPLIQALERAHPAIAKNGPHLEYPWEDNIPSVRLPSKDLGIAKELSSPESKQAVELVRLADELHQNWAAIFG